ncbi:hypothetical protein BGZ70_000884 [Mortierella alpina]|uniref:Uncharacterized protein n=1 Tax=Mortierella alpina TaxID=64518 RepID=A0A9P6IXD4_MORAP|nr:hypothetical protein BGZ70_000884 [Mortierella alpina]
MLSTPPASFDVLDSLANLHLDNNRASSSEHSNSRPRPSFRTFTRVAKTLPNSSSSLSSGLCPLSTTSSGLYSGRPTKSDSIPRKDSGHLEGILFSNPGSLNSLSSMNSMSSMSSDSDTAHDRNNGLERFKPRLSPPQSNEPSDYLQDPPACDPGHYYTAHRHYDRKSIEDLPKLRLTEDCAEDLHSPSKVSTSKPNPTFTRITRACSNNKDNNGRSSDQSTQSSNTNNHGGFYKLGGSGRLDCSSQSSSGSSSPLQMQENISSSLSKPVSLAPSASPASPGLSPAFHVRTLSLSLPLSPPPSAVPSLSSASSSCASSASASSPTRPHFLFPEAGKRDWWKGFGSLESPACLELDAAPGCTTAQGHDMHGSTERLQQDSDSNSSDKDHEAPLPVQLKQSRYQQIKPRTYFHTRTRSSSPPPVATGFCSISNPVKGSEEEPSPQDFLGEADLPYPLPSTLQDRQTRQRKRAEQLRQLKIREECEARENRRRARRRGVSFSAFTPTPSGSARSSFSQSLPAGAAQLAALGPPLMRSVSGSFSTASRIGSYRQKDRLQRSLSSSNKVDVVLGSGRANARKPKRCVGFDLKTTKVFEYEVGEEGSPCTGSPNQDEPHQEERKSCLSADLTKRSSSGIHRTS